MSTRLFFGLVLVCAALAWRVRSAQHVDRRGDWPASAPGSLDGERDAWRLRLVELSLVSGAVPSIDRALDDARGATVPWPPGFPSALGAMARQLWFREALRTGEFDERELQRRLGHVQALLGALATIAIALVVRAWIPAPSGAIAALAAAAAWAALPSIAFEESAGRLQPHASAALLACGAWAALALALRAQEEIDATLGGMLTGVACGLGVAWDSSLLPLALACTCTLALAAVGGRPGIRRAAVLFAISAAVVATMPWQHPSLPALAAERAGLLTRAPGWEPQQGLFAERVRGWIPAVLLPLSFVALLLTRKPGRHWPVLVLLAGSGTWAVAVDAHAGGVHWAAVLGLAVAAAAWSERRPLPTIAATCALCAPALAFYGSPSYRAESSWRAEWRAALDWLRFQTPSPGPWTSPATRADWTVCADPRLAAGVACLARRPTTTGALAGNPEGSQRVGQLLWSAEPEQALRELRVAGARYVLVARALASAPADGARALAWSALDPATEWSEECALVWPSTAALERRDRAELEVAVLELTPPREPEPAARMRSR